MVLITIWFKQNSLLSRGPANWALPVRGGGSAAWSKENYARMGLVFKPASRL
ncbi:hypothetical protein Dalk_2381 [Desulfatibacillum aliphaticivorans]|uniref:Uncharacterized protein n=1 Tax=Desulfatibacillum aliphaticivorans TaxID=218208 RepID=B8FAY8_DESAL|nr:hypothetical protein Dalk_2381 [Desulfatibacillum aliphaticivorans]